MAVMNEVDKENDYIFISTVCRILEKCKVFWSAEFFTGDNRVVIAALKLHIITRRISLRNYSLFHFRNLRMRVVFSCI